VGRLRGCGERDRIPAGVRRAHLVPGHGAGPGRPAHPRVPGRRPSFGGNGITAGPDGTVWTADGAGYLDRLTSGHAGRVRLPAGGVPFAVAAPAGQVVYVSELTGYFEYSRLLLASRPGRPATPALTLPSALSNIDALAAAPGGSVWFTDFGTGQVGELRPGGRVRLFADPAAWSGLSDITAGPDGAMWYTDQAGLIGRITVAGAISQLAMPGNGSNPDGIAAGAGGTIWVTGTGTDTIVRVALPARR
jgi:virginiamycin B lyase